MFLQFYGATDIGCVRQRNEDHYLVDAELGLAVVADGIGGLFRGDIASSVGCRAVRDHLRRFRRDLDAFRADPAKYKRDRVEDRLREAVQHANAEVFHAGVALSSGQGMGCTMEAVLVVENTAFVAHVGDARTYLVEHATARQLTDDHSVVAEKVRKGHMTAEEARTAPGKNVITRAVGHLPSVRVDTLVFGFQPGQRLVLVTDGVTRYLEDAEIGVLVHEVSPQAPLDVVRVGRQRGGADNLTIVVIAGQVAAPAPIDARILDELRRSWLFEGLTARELRRVAEAVVLSDFRAGRVLFREGMVGDELFVVLEGEVTVTRGGRTVLVCNEGDSVGEIALLDPPARTATALVTQPSRLAVIGRYAFDQILREDEGIASRVLLAMARRLSQVVRAQNERLRPEDF